MSIEFVDLNDNLRKISISGRLDIVGTEEISNKFSVLACADNLRVVVDLTAVSFLASIGIRVLITNAKALNQRHGRMVLFVNHNQAVINTLEAINIEELLPMYTELDQAIEAALA